ncbi:MAG: L,D-transpeptidase family protein [Clostridia bacterium]|nr:L,D-transpeptidase family protein [Clostridia bacterium]
MTEKQKNKLKRAVIIGLIILCFLLLLYFIMVIFYTKHFFAGTEINGVIVSGKSVGKVNEIMAGELKKYTLKLKERGDKEEEIKADEVGLEYNCKGDFKHIKEKQNPFKWFLAFVNPEDFKETEGVAYDNGMLEERVNKFACFDKANIVEPKNPTFRFEKGAYVIVDEVYGNKVNKEVFDEKLRAAILHRKNLLDLEATNCYINPQYTCQSPKIIETRDILNKYVASKITYTFVGAQVTLDKDTINKWLIVNEDFSVSVDEKKVKNYVQDLAYKYNTVGKTRQFKSSTGKTINIGRGDYGWVINISKETEALIAAIKDGQTISKEPIYAQRAAVKGSNDIGDTYVEINISGQYLWYYKNGTLITHGPIVTGNVSAGHSTPSGIYVLKYKQRDTVLRGRDYASPVAYWMPFNGGIGMHDANWRSSFGGNIYRTNGSHGCINCPYYLAKDIYNNISPGTPVICYY